MTEGGSGGITEVQLEAEHQRECKIPYCLLVADGIGRRLELFLAWHAIDREFEFNVGTGLKPDRFCVNGRALCRMPYVDIVFTGNEVADKHPAVLAGTAKIILWRHSP